MFQDVGIEQDGCMEVLIERGTELPHDFTCRIKPNDLNLLTLYEGNHIETKNNKQLGQYSLDHMKEGTFTLTLQVSKEYNMKILIDDFTLDTVSCSTTPEDVPVEEKRRWLNARNDFRGYIQSTLLFVDDTFTKKNLPEWEWVIEELEWAKQIMEYDVSTEEYIGALQEIENKINPLLQKTYHKKAFEKSPLLE